MQTYQANRLAIIIFIALVLGAIITICSCATPQIKNPQDAINEANITLTAVTKQLESNLTEGITTKKEGRDLLDQILAARTKVDQAQALLDAGNPLEAQNQLKLLNTALITLQKKIAEKARQ